MRELVVAGDGLRLAYHRDDFTKPWRKAQTIVLIHGACGSHRRFYSWVPRLARHYCVVRLDLRGHGDSEVPPPESELSMDRLVRDTVETLDHLGVDAVHVVGASAGGYVAQNLAIAAGARVKSLVLLGSTAGLKKSQTNTWPARIAAEGLRPFLAATIADRFPLERTDPGLVEWFLDDCSRTDPNFAARFIAHMSSLDWSDRLSEIRCPTLILVPGQETIGSNENYDVMRERIPDVQLIPYAGYPHNFFDSDPDRCIDDTLGFLDRRFGDAV